MNEGRYELLESRWIEDEIDYTGEQLRSHFVREVAGINGDGVVAFAGACNVEGSRLVDLEDAETASRIRAKRMLHFIGEHFLCSLREGNLRLRLFSSIVRERVEHHDPNLRCDRDGDDLFLSGRKLTVAICTASPVSLLFHFGVNIDCSGAPVPAIGLEEIGMKAEPFARKVLDCYSRECESVELALRKVRGVL